MIKAHNASRTRTAHAIESSNDKYRTGPLSGTAYKKQAKTAARQLGYPNSVLDRICRAESEAEVARIMKTARKEKFDESV